MAGTTLGPIIVWIDYGREGWVPESFATYLEALDYVTDGTLGRAVITRRIETSPKRPTDGD